MLKRVGRFPEELAKGLTRQLLLGLEYLHGQQ
jgi:serine/threonine protein kinase